MRGTVLEILLQSPLPVAFAILGVLFIALAIVRKVPPIDLDNSRAIGLGIFGLILIALAIVTAWFLASAQSPDPSISNVNNQDTSSINTNVSSQNSTSEPSVTDMTTLPPPDTLISLPDKTPTSPSKNLGVLEFRLCNRDQDGNTFTQTNMSTGVTRIEILPSAEIFFISTDPAKITFSPNSSLAPIYSNGNTQYVILGKSVPNLEWIELDAPGSSYTACIYSSDQFTRAESEASNDMDIKKDRGYLSEYYFIEGKTIELIEFFPNRASDKVDNANISPDQSQGTTCYWDRDWLLQADGSYLWVGAIPGTAGCENVGQDGELLQKLGQGENLTLIVDIGDKPLGLDICNGSYQASTVSDGETCLPDRPEMWPKVSGQLIVKTSTGFLVGTGE